jgi:(p)ppGpp synthase/HD superfamily hydrolase
LWEADLIAASAHDGVTDKVGAPYIEHARAVAAGLADFEVEIQVAGVLHDVIEDTGWTFEDLQEAGVTEKSLEIIEAVTKMPGCTKRQQIERVVQGGRGAILVKIADNAHNTHPDRLALLDRATGERLLVKYREAREVLWSSVPMDDVAKILARVNPHLHEKAVDFMGG